MDYFMTSFMITTIDKIHTGYFLYDIVISFFLIIGINFMIKESNRNNILFKIYNLIDLNNKYNSITYTSSEKDVSIRYRALMWLISKNDDPSVRKVSEVELRKYNNQTDTTECHTSFYRVSQNHKFNITTIKGKKIIGHVFWYSKDKSETFGKISYVDYQNLELIFWDNHSTDQSKNIIESYDDKRIKYFFSKNHTTLYQARNLALKKCKGDFVCFLDVDDYFIKNTYFLK
jgi:hypothetical protein